MKTEVVSYQTMLTVAPSKLRIQQLSNGKVSAKPSTAHCSSYNCLCEFICHVFSRLNRNPSVLRSENDFFAQVTRSGRPTDFSTVWVNGDQSLSQNTSKSNNALCLHCTLSNRSKNSQDPYSYLCGCNSKENFKLDKAPIHRGKWNYQNLDCVNEAWSLE